MSKDAPTSMEAVNEAYAGRTKNLDAGKEDKTTEAEKARENSGIESIDTPLDETQRFVGNPEDLRKDVSSEEEFSESLTDGDDDLKETTSEKTATKKTAAKKG